MSYLTATAVDPHSLFADPDPAVFLNADPDPAAFVMQIWIQLKKIFYKIILRKVFSS